MLGTTTATDIQTIQSRINTSLTPYLKIADNWVIKGGYATCGKTGSSNLGSTTYFGSTRISYGYTFSSEPWVQLTAKDIGSGVFGVEIDSTVSTSWVDVTIYGADSSTYGVYWLAIGR